MLNPLFKTRHILGDTSEPDAVATDAPAPRDPRVRTLDDVRADLMQEPPAATAARLAANAE
jgi:hypothetical protein